MFFLRELYKKNRTGNTKVPWLAGPVMVRRVSGGNVRRFIQICDNLFEESKVRHLRANQQHEAVMDFAKRHVTRAKSVYRDGFLLETLIEVISDYLFEKMHGGSLIDVGIEFNVSDELLSHDNIKRALEMGVAYSYFSCDEPDLFYGIHSGTSFRLANIVAATKWLPMRAGAGIRLSSHSGIKEFLEHAAIILPQFQDEVARNLELDFSND